MRAAWIVAVTLIIGCVGSKREEAPAQTTASATFVPPSATTPHRPLLRRPIVHVQPSASVR